VSTVAIAGTPVFVDATGRRVMAARIAVRVSTALLLILVAATVMSVIGRLPMPGLARSVMVPVGETPRPHQDLDITKQGVAEAPVQRADVSQSAQAAFQRDDQSPLASARPDAATSIPASVPQTPTPRPTVTRRTASSGPTTPAPPTAAPTPTSTPRTRPVRPTPPNRPVQPHGQSGSHGGGAQHGPPSGHGPQR
jgi:hypothetical protein